MTFNPVGYYGYPQMQQQQVQPPIQNQQPMLHGKIVENVEVVKCMDLPIGSSGVYPKADGNSVYIKSWNSNGTTNISEYVKVVETPKEEGVNVNDVLMDIVNSINALEKKIDAIKPTSSTATRRKVKEGVADE